MGIIEALFWVTRGKSPQGLKPRFILLTLLARLKPCRCYKTVPMSFSASCKVVQRFQRLERTDESLCKGTLTLTINTSPPGRKGRDRNE